MFEIEEFPEKWETRGIELYYIITIIAVFISFELNLLLPPTDANSVRYMLSALVQSEAAIIAVVVSLSLLGVQLVASLGKYDEAIHAYDKATSIDPQFGMAWYNKGIALKAINRKNESEEAFAKAGELKFKS
ncbi:MAG: tetratricopeptide repeat protein [Methanotrichaceae archaeon]|nr:tetratricopeptide repeat protein [Methanotrichaceae archaeon]